MANLFPAAGDLRIFRRLPLRTPADLSDARTFRPGFLAPFRLTVALLVPFRRAPETGRFLALRRVLDEVFVAIAAIDVPLTGENTGHQL